jgi:hypothetical protein
MMFITWQNGQTGHQNSNLPLRRQHSMVEQVPVSVYPRLDYVEHIAAHKAMTVSDLLGIARRTFSAPSANFVRLGIQSLAGGWGFRTLKSQHNVLQQYYNAVNEPGLRQATQIIFVLTEDESSTHSSKLASMGDIFLIFFYFFFLNFFFFVQLPVRRSTEPPF